MWSQLPSPAPGEPSHWSHRVVESRGARGQRRHHLDRKFDRWRRRGGSHAARCHDCGRRGTSGWCHVDGRWRVRVISSQSDTEQADIARERKESSENAEFELDELAEIYVKRGVDQPLAREVGERCSAAHARDELGISEITTARPVQAALTSAVMFSVGAAMPLLMVVVSPASALVPIVSTASLGFLALLGAIGARTGGANILRATARVTFWGALAMAITAGIGKVFSTVV